MTSFPPPAETVSARIRTLYNYWDTKRAGRMMPHRSEIEPGDLKDLLPYLIVGELVRSPIDVRYRLVGTAVVEAYGHDFMGRHLRTMPVTTGLDRWLVHYRRLADEKRPLYGRYRGEIGPDLIRFVDYGVFPLSHNGVTVGQFIELEDWSQIRGISPANVESALWHFEAY